MATIRQAAQNVLGEARDGIAWIALWKDGRGWKSEAFYPDYDERTQRFTFEDYELEKLRSVFRRDPDAILVNGYHCNLGDPDCMTRDTLANALRWQYENRVNLVVDILINLYKMTKAAR